MTTMHMPGFTAEASLFNGKERYPSASKMPSHGGYVQAASDVFHPNRPIWCVSAMRCRFDRFGQPRCSNTGFGIWNHMTGRCDPYPNAWSN